MNIKTALFLFIDCQTTGMHPSNGHLLELSWLVATADTVTPEIKSYLVQLPEGEVIPSAVQKITGITATDLEKAEPIEKVYEELQKTLQSLPAETVALIHYAQFEKAFLKYLFTRHHPEKEFPLEVICTAKVCRKVFPNITSGNIRAISGFIGTSVGLKRAASHVQATFEIWQELVSRLSQHSVTTVEQLDAWMKEAKPVDKEAKFEYRMDRLTRLAFPDQPGIYRMYNKKNEILYVGKATSLKSRVNSYFRVKKKRDKKTMELLAQVWSIEYTECYSPLQAALLETDEIKRLDPPYNINLKKNRAKSFFTSKDLKQISGLQTTEFPLGPFRPFGSIEQLSLLQQGLTKNQLYQIFHDSVETAILEEGFELFCSQNNLSTDEFLEPRRILAFGFNQIRLQKKLKALAVDTDVTRPELEMTADAVADKFMRLCVRAAGEYKRSRALNRLVNASIRWLYKNEWLELKLKHGHLVKPDEEIQTVSEIPAINDWPVATYDRMSILLSELAKYPHQITVGRFESNH